MTYHGMDNCDDCGRPLEQRQWLVGLCRACEEARKAPKEKACDRREDVVDITDGAQMAPGIGYRASFFGL